MLPSHQYVFTPLTAWVYYTGKTSNATNGSRTIIGGGAVALVPKQWETVVEDADAHDDRQLSSGDANSLSLSAPINVTRPATALFGNRTFVVVEPPSAEVVARGYGLIRVALLNPAYRGRAWVAANAARLARIGLVNDSFVLGVIAAPADAASVPAWRDALKANNQIAVGGANAVSVIVGLQ
jgi:hypothetical protein